MKLSNVRQIRAEDFEEDYSQLTTQLGTVLNSFMQEVVELTNGRIDFDNLNQSIKSFDITLGSDGTPTQSFKLNVDKDNIRGIIVVRVINLTKSNEYPTSAPFITWNPIGGSLVEVKHITGLLPNNKYRLTIITY